VARYPTEIRNCTNCRSFLRYFGSVPGEPDNQIVTLVNADIALSVCPVFVSVPRRSLLRHIKKEKIGDNWQTGTALKV
jgi:hypothetical protein